MGREVNLYYSDKNRVILFLNDEPHSSVSFQNVLNKYSLTLVCTTNRTNAVYIAENLEPALILVDLNLKEDISSASIKKTKTIFISAFEADFFENQLKNIMSYFLIKPAV